MKMMKRLRVVGLVGLAGVLVLGVLWEWRDAPVRRRAGQTMRRFRRM